MFRSEIFFRTTQELEYLFFVAQSAIFFPELNIRLYDKNSESDFFFFFLHQNQNIFFSNIGNQNIFLEKNHTPPFMLNGRSRRLSEFINRGRIDNLMPKRKSPKRHWSTKHTHKTKDRVTESFIDLYEKYVVVYM